MTNIAEILRRLVAGAQPAAISFLASVVSVDEQKGTCDVKDADGAEYFDVKLCAQEGKCDVLVLPKEGSSVIVAHIEGIPGFLHVAQFSEVDRIILHGGELGGLVKARELAQEINKIRSLLDAIGQAVSSWVPVPSDGGAALKALLSSLYLPLPLPNSDELENEKIKQ